MPKSFAKTLAVVYSEFVLSFRFWFPFGMVSLLHSGFFMLLIDYGSKFLRTWGCRRLRLCSQNTCGIYTGDCEHNPHGRPAWVWQLSSACSTWGVSFKFLGGKIHYSGFNQFVFSAIQGFQLRGILHFSSAYYSIIEKPVPSDSWAIKCKVQSSMCASIMTLCTWGFDLVPMGVHIES